MTPMEIVQAMFNEFNKLNQRLDKIESALKGDKSTLGKGIYTLTEASEYLNFSKSYLYKLTSTNQIPFYKTGKRIYFKREHLDEYLTRNYMRSEQETDHLANEYIMKNPLKWR